MFQSELCITRFDVKRAFFFFFFLDTKSRITHLHARKENIPIFLYFQKRNESVGGGVKEAENFTGRKSAWPRGVAFEWSALEFSRKHHRRRRTFLTFRLVAIRGWRGKTNFKSRLKTKAVDGGRVGGLRAWRRRCGSDDDGSGGGGSFQAGSRLRAGIKVAHRGMKRLTPGDSRESCHRQRRAR